MKLAGVTFQGIPEIQHSLFRAMRHEYDALIYEGDYKAYAPQDKTLARGFWEDARSNLSYVNRYLNEAHSDRSFGAFLRQLDGALRAPFVVSLRPDFSKFQQADSKHLRLKLGASLKEVFQNPHRFFSTENNRLPDNDVKTLQARFIRRILKAFRQHQFGDPASVSSITPEALEQQLRKTLKFKGPLKQDAPKPPKTKSDLKIYV